MKDEKRLCAKNGNNFNTYVQKQNKIKYQCNIKQRQSSLELKLYSLLFHLDNFEEEL